MINILEKFIGFVFLLAGLYRIKLKDRREYEAYKIFKLPKYSDYLIIIIEILCGIIILFDLSVKYYAILIITIIVSIGTILILFNNFDEIISTYYDLFTFNNNSLSVLIHLTYIIILIYLQI